MSDKLTAWLRTVVPGLWAALITWLLSLGLPASIGDLLAGGEEFVMAAVLAAVYAGLRWLEPRMPAWLTRILLGSNTPPTYEPTADAPHRS
ncbi:hypothetical protein MOQ72_29200 [Saccharopolyspora sp. K220]|uniref:hypothetical protein n=1 Tax=Saccharopolyspora soli TaxID=2926618 RepID=UPI001F592942|nr:hypothetical protein [Saccharopolyspora soli]MCI2421519.1 hypothetical protein [Saccharopolyspora soli]